jgi:hypothetical protein
VVGKVLDAHELIPRALRRSDQLVQLRLYGSSISVLWALHNEYHQNVTMVIAVFKASCQVFDQPNNGPLEPEENRDQWGLTGSSCDPSRCRREESVLIHLP